MKKTKYNLVPDIKNPTPDYYCTWQTQLYATSDGKPEKQRAIIGEKGLFAEKKPFGWAYFYEKARGDLFLVMDDSWDVPLSGDRSYYGSLILDKDKFPKATKDTKTNAEALKNLSDRVRALGWKGLGGWVCAQESKLFLGEASDEEYWIHRLREADASGFSYWKVDWGKRSTSADFRLMLTALGRKYAPNLVIEQAMVKDIIPKIDVYRTYDVPAIFSIPMTMQKLAEFSTVGKTEEGALGLVNCEDEVYVAAAGGFAMGIMRHSYEGALPDGRADMSFPAIHRNLKTKMYEVIRAARFHRIAPAFGVDADGVTLDSAVLRDTWRFENRDEEIEAWWFQMPAVKEHLCGDTVMHTAPARFSRNAALPAVVPDEKGNVPYIVAAKNPNGVFSVATLGRTTEREYWIPKCHVTVKSGDAQTIGVFGEYAYLTLDTAFSAVKTILMQDLASDAAYDITSDVCMENNRIKISGELIQKIGTEAQPVGDTSEAGVVIRLVL